MAVAYLWVVEGFNLGGAYDAGVFAFFQCDPDAKLRPVCNLLP